MFRAAMGVALLPFVVSAGTVLVGARGYTSFGDNALTELGVRDVGRHAVEVGVFNRFGWHHPGPAVFYFLAPVYRALGSTSSGLLIAALLLNAGAVVGIALVARARAGVGFAVAALAGATIACQALGPSFLRSPWTPNLIVLPFVLIVLLSWSVAEGDIAALPWAALVASFVVQAHLAPTPPIVAMLAAAMALGARRLRSNGLRNPSMLRGRTCVTAGVLAIMWFPPFVDVATHSGGNLRAVLDYFATTHPSGTLGGGYRVVASQLALPPPWLGADPFPHGDLLYGSVVRHGAAPWIAIAFVLAVLVAWRARQHRALRFATVVGVALAAEIVGISRISGPLYHWDLTYVPVTAMLTALAGAYCIWSALPPATRIACTRPAALLVVGALIVPASILTIASGDPTQVQDYDGSRGVSLVARAALRSLRDTKGTVLVRGPDSAPNGYGYLAAMVVLLDQHGFHAVVGGEWSSVFPQSSIQTTGAVDAVLTVLSASDARRYRAAPGERRVAGNHADTPDARGSAGTQPTSTPVVFLAAGVGAGSLGQ